MPFRLQSPMPRRRADVWAALAGVVSALVTLAIAELASLLLGGIGNPVLAVGSLIIDLAPPGVKTLVIDLFDTADKVFLFVVIAVLVLALAVVAGVLQLRRPPYGLLVLVAVAAVALLAVVTRADMTPLSAVPTVVGAVAGILILRLTVLRLRGWRARLVQGVVPGERVWERRNFLQLSFVLGATAIVVGVGARIANTAAAAANEVRRALNLPAPTSAAPAVAEGDTLDDLEGISSWVTPNDEFYRIDTALAVPAVDAADWSLRIVGMVEEEVEIGFEELLALPMIERYVTLTCVSNEVGGGLIGNARWLGHPIRELLARARPTGGADMVLSRSIDGFTASTPLSVLQDAGTDAVLAVAMNGEPLPLEHGFPVRMVVPGLYGYVSATKWVVELKVTTFEQDFAYWSTRGWTERGPIKLSSRIDTAVAASGGEVVVGGVAWAQHTGIDRVEVRIDDGDWMPAELAPTVTIDSWLQWSARLTASSGSHEVTVRATDADGTVQTADEAPPAPDGSTGLHSLTVDFP